MSTSLTDIGLDRRIRVGVLGATGSVGQRFVSLLAGHPWFEIGALTASERSAGKAYGDAVKWVQDAPLPDSLAGMTLLSSEPPLDCPLVFSAMDASVAGPIEEAFAREGHLVVSNTKSHRMDRDVPLVVPEVNPDHLELALRQSYRGAIITNPNCSTIGLVMALKPLADAFGLERVHVVTLQAVSGAGLPGVSSYEIFDNVIPFISGEEEKMERESRKILGRLENGAVVDADLVVSAQCNRVGVVDGHTECVSVGLTRQPTEAEILDAWETFSSEPQRLRLPSAPARPIYYFSQPNAPQPRLHRNLERGMAAAIGRLRRCKLLDFKFVVLSHNTIRGAAGGALLAGELAVAKGLLPGVPAVSEPESLEEPKRG